MKQDSQIAIGNRIFPSLVSIKEAKTDESVLQKVQNLFSTLDISSVKSNSVKTLTALGQAVSENLKEFEKEFFPKSQYQPKSPSGRFNTDERPVIIQPSKRSVKAQTISRNLHSKFMSTSLQRSENQKSEDEDLAELSEWAKVDLEGKLQDDFSRRLNQEKGEANKEVLAADTRQKTEIEYEEFRHHKALMRAVLGELKERPQTHQKTLMRAVLCEIKERPQTHQKNLKRAVLSEIKERQQIHLKRVVLSEIIERAQIRKLRATCTKANKEDLNTSPVKQAYNLKEIQQKLVQLNLMNMKTQNNVNLSDVPFKPVKPTKEMLPPRPSTTSGHIDLSKSCNCSNCDCVNCKCNNCNCNNCKCSNCDCNCIKDTLTTSPELSSEPTLMDEDDALIEVGTTNRDRSKVLGKRALHMKKDVINEPLTVSQLLKTSSRKISFPQISKEVWKPTKYNNGAWGQTFDKMTLGDSSKQATKENKQVYSINKQVHDNLAKLPQEYQVKTLTCPVCSLEVKSTPKNEKDMTEHVEKHFVQKLMCPISPCFKLYDQRKQADFERHVDSHFTNESDAFEVTEGKVPLIKSTSKASVDSMPLSYKTKQVAHTLKPTAPVLEPRHLFETSSIPSTSTGKFSFTPAPISKMAGASMKQSLDRALPQFPFGVASTSLPVVKQPQSNGKRSLPYPPPLTRPSQGADSESYLTRRKRNMGEEMKKREEK